VSQDPAQQYSASEQMSAQREYQRYAQTDVGEFSATEEPDVLLDVPTLEVDKISLEVEGHRSRGNRQWSWGLRAPGERRGVARPGPRPGGVELPPRDARCNR
jgi:hypothetical protein